jgi:Tfp pilus assembly protein PilF
MLCALLALGGCAAMGGSEEPKVAAPPPSQKVPPETFKLAQKALDAERLKDAELLVDRILLTDPGNLDARLMRGEIILASGRPNEALSTFSGLLDLPEVSARAHQGTGIALLLTNAPDAALEHLTAAVEQDPKLWRAWNALGSYYDTQEDWADSVDAYGKALAEHPNNAMILNNRGFSHFMQGDMDEAIADLQRALRLDPKLRPAQINLRLAHAWNGQYLRAMSGVTDKELPQVLNNIGYVAMMRGDLDNAEAYLQRAMEADPTFNEKAWNNLSQLRHMRQMSAEERNDLPQVTPKDITAAVTGE